ncbi:hypothetical protein QTO34_004099 [Cnephaeus nilssonii]|uniref:Uncharacterized protein n=1 Tax=Cnephaeus nilssonii TaxID=3371016 RepID=A0AA40HRW6_CNENI|nr:hypothetical protein QTO34_004099 [Eptesicus nilssonii]
MCPWVWMKLNPGSGRGRVPLDPGEAGSRVRQNLVIIKLPQQVALLSLFQIPALMAEILKEKCSVLGAKKKTFSGYFGTDQSKWKPYDAAHLVKSDPGSQLETLTDQGKDDQLLSDGQLLPDNSRSFGTSVG